MNSGKAVEETTLESEIISNRVNMTTATNRRCVLKREAIAKQISEKALFSCFSGRWSASILGYARPSALATHGRSALPPARHHYARSSARPSIRIWLTPANPPAPYHEHCLSFRIATD